MSITRGIQSTEKRARRTERSAAALARRTASLSAAAVLVATVAAASTSPAPLAVSPGGEPGAAISDTCPTFHWASLAGATAYELVVYVVDQGGVAEQPMLGQRIPGAALGWTAPLGRCLERGERYAWSVRAETADGVSDWSAPLFFGVAEPSREELAAALELVRRYLDAEESARAEPVSLADALSEARLRVERADTHQATKSAPDPDARLLAKLASPASAFPGAKMTVVGEVRMTDEDGELRLWGRGRPDTVVYPKPITPGTHYCFNPASDVTYGLSRVEIGWGAAADACPSGTWVCKSSDIVACDTSRPDDASDLRSCDGNGVNLTADNHVGWIAEAQGEAGRTQSETGVVSGFATCASLPVWCCWE